MRRNREENAKGLDTNLLKNWEAWKTGTRDRTVLSFRAGYTADGFVATESLGDDFAARGIARFLGSFDLLNRDVPNAGRLDFEIVHRHSETDKPSILSGALLCFALLCFDGMPQPLFYEDGFRTTVLCWRQDPSATERCFGSAFSTFRNINVYALASPWTGFQTLAFPVARTP